MRFLESPRILANMWAATRYLTGEEHPLTALKGPFIRALNAVQASALHDDADVTIDFDSPAITASCLRTRLIRAEDLEGNRHLVAAELRGLYGQGIATGLDLIRRADLNLHYMIRQLTSTISCYHVPGTDGGSISSCIGLIYLSPNPAWTPEYYAELIVHEFVHNAMYLEDMVRCVFPDPRLWTCDEAMATSAIRQTLRPFDKVYHSACVSVGVMYIKHLLGLETGEYLEPLRRSVIELAAADERLKASSKEILSDNGRVILEQIRRFADSPDYDYVRSLIQPESALLGA